ncbi:MAG: hypothetical protein JO257_24235 [Deltaproteobacteria bacterium]|nr:hypothetical protein [Deltaproteobacteria bacterium]
MSTRRAILAAGGVLVVLLAILAWKARSGGEMTPTAAVTQAPAPAITAPAPVASASGTAAAPALPSAGSADVVDDQGRPQPVPLPPGANPPPLDGKHSEPAPPQKAFTPAEVIAKREADLKLLDDTKTRLEKDLEAAKTAHDATTAHDLEIRIARLTDLRKRRSTELDQLKGSAQ